MSKLYRVDGTSEQQGVDRGMKFAIWRVVRVDDPKHLICAFFGGASYHAAHIFCDTINNDPKWNTSDHT